MFVLSSYATPSYSLVSVTYPAKVDVRVGGFQDYGVCCLNQDYGTIMGLPIKGQWYAVLGALLIEHSRT